MAYHFLLHIMKYHEAYLCKSVRCLPLFKPVGRLKESNISMKFNDQTSGDWHDAISLHIHQIQFWLSFFVPVDPNFLQLVMLPSGNCT